MIRLKRPQCTRTSTLMAILWLSSASLAWSQPKQTIVIRGHEQTLHLYGSPQADPIIVSGGDGGWIHLGPHVAEFLSRRGFFLNSSSDATLLPTILAAAAEPTTSPSAAALAGDVARFAMEPLFVRGVSDAI